MSKVIGARSELLSAAVIRLPASLINIPGIDPLSVDFCNAQASAVSRIRAASSVRCSGASFFESSRRQSAASD